MNWIKECNNLIRLSVRQRMKSEAIQNKALYLVAEMKNSVSDFKFTLTKKLRNGKLKMYVRYNDDCKNGYRSFAMTGDLWESRRCEPDMCGCIHDELEKHFPEYARFIKWHLTSEDEPMHYVANTVYHAECGKLDYARNSAIAPDYTLEQLQDKDLLYSRLPNLMSRFFADMKFLKEKNDTY